MARLTQQIMRMLHMYCVLFEAVQAGKQQLKVVAAAVMKGRADAVESKGTGIVHDKQHLNN